MSLPTTYSWVLSIGGEGSTGIPVGGGSVGNRGTGNGKTGFAAPFAADGRGRAAYVSGDQQLRKTIMLNLSDLESSNPFQGDIGLGADMVFAVSSVKLRQEVQRKINALFRRLQLQDRARLDGKITFQQDSQNQELLVDINYMNLEEDKPAQNLGLKFSLVNATGAR